jgi:signal transduction histidine kinase/CheY-like chemotaxis protein
VSAVTSEDGVAAPVALSNVAERRNSEAGRVHLLQPPEKDGAQRQQSARFESLGQLTGGIVHDFNNLLVVIMNCASFVAEEAAQGVTDDDEGLRWSSVRDDVARIRHAAQRASDLTHRLLAFTRREVILPQILDLNEVIRDVGQLLHRTMTEHVEFKIRLTPGTCHVLADPGQVEQVLVNLAVNACDAMPRGGFLTIDTEQVMVYGAQLNGHGLKRGPHVRVRVTDSGTGMAADVIARAAEPFFTTKARGEGSGLGLATVYGIVNRAGGNVEICSEPGIGTTISVLFPVTMQVRAHRRPPAATRSTTAHETIMVVEDDEAIVDVTRHILTRNGYEVVTAASGAQAIELARAHEGTIDVLLTDVVMPKMLGKDLAAYLLGIRPDLRVLYMSGYAQPVLTSRGILDNGMTLLVKPFDESALVAKIQDVLGAL